MNQQKQSRTFSKILLPVCKESRQSCCVWTHSEVKAVSADWVGVVGYLDSSAVSIYEGVQPQQEGGMHSAVAALPVLMVAGVQELPLKVGVVYDGLISLGTTAPYSLPELILLRRLQQANQNEPTVDVSSMRLGCEEIAGKVCQTVKGLAGSHLPHKRLYSARLVCKAI